MCVSCLHVHVNALIVYIQYVKKMCDPQIYFLHWKRFQLEDACRPTALMFKSL